MNDIEPTHLSIKDIDALFGDTVQEKKAYGIFEVPLLFIYKNEITNTFAEFELNDINPDITTEEAIEIFMQMVVAFGKDGYNSLPDTLLVELDDKELDCFLLAGEDEKYYQMIKSRIYIQKANQYYQDNYGFEYIVAGVGSEDTILFFEQNTKLITLHTNPQQLQQQGGRLYVTRDDGL